jgi:hypothetical protein
MYSISRVVVTAVMLGASAVLSAQDFCSVMKHVRALSTTDFAATKGGSKSDNTWYVRQTLPGFRECQLTLLPKGSTTYTCQSAALDERAVEAAVWKQVAQIEQCLGSAVRLIGERNGSIASLFPNDELGTVMVNQWRNMTMEPGTGNILSSFVVSLTIFSASPKSESTADAAVENESVPEKGKPVVFADKGMFCPRLQKVIDAASRNFDPIKGKGAAKEGWDTTVKLPSLSRCTIESLGGTEPYYNCRASEQPDQETSLQDMDAATRLIDECLDDSWEVRTRMRNSGNVKLKRVDFWKGDSYPTVEVRQSDPSYDGDSWDVLVDVEIPDQR